MKSRMDRYVLKKTAHGLKFTLIQILGVAAVSITGVAGSYLAYQQFIEKDKEVVVDSLEGKLEAGKLQIEINAYPTFDTGTANGNLLIANKLQNRYDMIVKIYLTENNKLVYTSPKIEPGKKIEKDNLDVELDKGEYNAIAYFSAYDRETNAYVGQSAAQIEITVKK